MQIIINNKPLNIPAKTSVSGLIKLLSYKNQRIALAINDEIIPKSAYDTKYLSVGAKVDIIEAVGGG